MSRAGEVYENSVAGERVVIHIPHHTTNDNTEQEGGGGLMTVINVTE